MDTSRWSRETPAPGVVVYQPRKGFRYSVDAFWLVGAALQSGRAHTAMDLGAGSGVMALLMAAQGLDVIAVDSEAAWKPGWTYSLEESDVKGSVCWLAEDVLNVVEKVDLIVCNPPYFPASSGPCSPNPWKRAARTEGTARLSDFVNTALRCLKPAGVAWFVLPIEREREMSVLAPNAVRECIQIGQRRILVRLMGGSSQSRKTYAEDSLEVAAWIARSRQGVS